MKFTLIFILFIASFISSCSTYSENDKTDFEQEIDAFIATKKWKMTKSASGLRVEVLQVGTGTEKIQSASEVSLQYSGKLLKGTTFDRTTKNNPMKCELKGLIRGFQEGLLGQTKGAKIRLVIPPQLGYGDMELERIPENSILIFEIEVLEVI